jgi:hypothetical protein
VKVKFLTLLDRIGSALFGMLTGLALLCFLAMTLHTAPLAEKFFGGAFDYTQGIMFGMSPDRMWCGYMQTVSGGAFAQSPPIRSRQQLYEQVCKPSRPEVAATLQVKHFTALRDPPCPTSIYNDRVCTDRGRGCGGIRAVSATALAAAVGVGSLPRCSPWWPGVPVVGVVLGCAPHERSRRVAGPRRRWSGYLSLIMLAARRPVLPLPPHNRPRGAAVRPALLQVLARQRPAPSASVDAPGT